MGKFKIVILGLSITSSWGNGHATTYRGLARALDTRGHSVLFLERDKPWYAAARDLSAPPYAQIGLYESVDDLKSRFAGTVRDADLAVVGSYVPEGAAIGEWVTETARGVTAFYDIDTPVTLSLLDNGGADYLTRDLIPRYRLYLSFTGGSILTRLRQEFGAPVAHPLYCSVDPTEYFPERGAPRWNLGYMGTYSSDRQAALDRLLIAPARTWPGARMAVAGAQYPQTISWPENVQRIEHLPPAAHRQFYGLQQYTLNVTRALMIEAGYSPSVRLFEAAACACPIITDAWEGLTEFFEPGREILVAESAERVLEYLRKITPEERERIGQRARSRVVASATPAHRAAELERVLRELL